VQVHIDAGNEEAALFGAKTSGEVAVYDGRGKRLFHGGLTASRGHVGPSMGRTRVTALLREGKADHASASVFGCALADPSPPLTQRDP
jgi:hypothetical protein